MAMLLGFSSKVLQSSQSRNFDAFLAGNTQTEQTAQTQEENKRKVQSELALCSLGTILKC